MPSKYPSAQGTFTTVSMGHCKKCFTCWLTLSPQTPVRGLWWWPSSHEQGNRRLERASPWGATQLTGGGKSDTRAPPSTASPHWGLVLEPETQPWRPAPDPLFASSWITQSPSCSSLLTELGRMESSNLTRMKIMMHVDILTHKVKSSWIYSKFYTISQFFQNTFS